jgi:hypothetical protein
MQRAATSRHIGEQAISPCGDYSDRGVAVKAELVPGRRKGNQEDRSRYRIGTTV